MQVLSQLNLPASSLSLSDVSGDVARASRPWELVPAGHRIGAVEPIFKEMKDDEMEALRARFAGSQADRKNAEEAAAAAGAGAAGAGAGAGAGASALEICGGGCSPVIFASRAKEICASHCYVTGKFLLAGHCGSITSVEVPSARL